LPLLRLRSDDQLVALFREGHDDAFRAIHDRYHKRLLAYMRQMLPRRQDAEDALQEVFVRAYFGLRAHDRELCLRAWLFRVAHNRCIDELRRPTPPPPEIIDMLRPAAQDPAAEVDCRESLRRLIADVRRLPDQQRSALLMRELGGMPYADLANMLGVSVPAVKSLLVRARVGLARAAEARDTACSEIREQLACAHDHGVRPNAMARRHMRDCSGCRSFRRDLRGVSRQLAALAPTLGPLGVLAKLLGGSSGAGGSTAAVGGAAGAGGTASSAGLVVGANHVAALLAAAVATGGAVAIQHTISSRPHSAPARAGQAAARSPASAPSAATPVVVYAPNGAAVTVPATAVTPAPSPTPPLSRSGQARRHRSQGSAGLTSAVSNGSASAAQTVDSSSANTLAGGSTQTSPPASTTDQPATSAGSAAASSGSSLLPTGSGSTGAVGTSGSSQPSSGSSTGGSTTSSGSGSTGSASSGSSGSGSASGSSSSQPTATTSSAGSTSGSSTGSSGTSSGTSSSGTGSTTAK
jgi:RNA polymerase sigma factor (sigma-70 family)